MAINFPSSPTTGQSYTDITTGQTWIYNGTGWASSYNRSSVVRQSFTASAGQTTFTVSGGYAPGLLDVYQNGVKLVSGSDYTAINGSTFILTAAATAGDAVEAWGLANFVAANMVSKAGDTMSGDLVLSTGQTVNTLVPAGAVMTFAMNSAPGGWVKANGAALSRSVYSALFTAVGTTFGVGDGSTTFNVPDLRGEFIRGWDDGRGIDTGRTFGSAQTDAFKSHNHSYGALYGFGASNTGYSTITSGGTYSTTSVGGTETRPRNIALLACIKF